MPIFEYKCGKCKKEFEELVFGDGEDMKCPACGGKAKKLLSRCRSQMHGFGPGFGDVPNPGPNPVGGGSGGCSGCSGGDCSSCS